LGSGLNVVATIRPQGVQTDSISHVADLGDGRYRFVFTASAIAGGNDLITVTVGSVVLNQTVVIG